MKFVMLERHNGKIMAVCTETGTLVQPGDNLEDCWLYPPRSGAVLMKGTVAEVVGKLEGRQEADEDEITALMCELNNANALSDMLAAKRSRVAADRDRYRAALVEAQERLQDIYAGNGGTFAAVVKLIDAALGEVPGA